MTDDTLKCGPAMSKIPAEPAQIIAAVHTRIASPFIARSASYQERLDWLGEEMCTQLTEVLAVSPDEPWLHIVCTTCLSTMLTGCDESTNALFDLIENRCGIRPTALLQPYECTGWGYALRFAALHTDYRRLAISIVDVDMHDAFSVGFEEAIGKFGFGVTTVGIELPENVIPPQCDGPLPNRAFNDLLHATRALHCKQGRTPTFMPFLIEGMSAMVEKWIGTDIVAPNRHAVYGHSFGADPWIGVIEWVQGGHLQTKQTVTLGAFAFDGYYTLCNFTVAPSVKVKIRHFEPLHEAPRVMVEAL